MKNIQVTLLSILLVIMVSCSQTGIKTSEVSIPVTCNETALPELPDVTITSITQETEPAAHCKVSGVIGKEIKFELHLPTEWNG